MSASSALAQLLSSISLELSTCRALDSIVSAALELTGSRHVLIALMNDELGCLEVRHGAGEEYLDKR
jgi:hypothetical protein